MKDYTQKVDFHSHFLPPAYIEYLDKYEGPTPDSFPTPDWSLKDHMKEMDDLGVAFALISISSPAVINAKDDAETLDYVRRINEEGASYVKKYPHRLGLMAELPLPLVEDSVKEAKYALEKLGAYGFGLKTNYNSIYLGDPSFDPLMEYLNKKGALIAVHPTMPGALPKGVNKDFPIPAMEFFTETTRTFVNMENHDLFARYPDIKWVFPHAGAYLSLLDDRINMFKIFTKKAYPKARLDVYEDMKHVYFDLAGCPLPKQLQLLRKDVPMDHMFYGSDCPYTPKAACVALAGQLEDTDQLTDDEKYNIFTRNAVELLPQLKDHLDVKSNGDSKKKRGKKAGKGKRSFMGKAYNRVMSVISKI